MPDQLHATERPADEQAPVIERLLDEMEKRGFMPIIFKHLTRAFIVDNATTYAYVMADGLVRLGRLMSHDPTPPRELRVLAASRVAPDAYGVQTPMTRDDDVPRIEERLGIERARANAHRRELEWTWTIRFGSGKKRPDLWIADALSNAWRRLKTFPSDTRQRLRAFFAPHEKQLSPNRENEVGWTRAKTITLALTSANHRGAVSVADAHLTRLRPMRPALARQFEHLPLLLDGQFGQAVHQSNTDHITLRSLALGARRPSRAAG